MKLTSMKVDPKAREARYKESAVVDAPLYPWGLCITLDEEAIEALGIETLPKVGEKPLMLVARVDVTSVSSNEGADKKPRRTISLQITDLALGPDEGGKDAAKSLYKE